MRDRKLIIFAIVSLALTVWSYQSIFSPSNQMIGTPSADTYQAFQAIHKGLQVIESGHLPFGVFWLPDFYGGSIASYFYVSFIPSITSSALMLINILSNDLILAIKILTFASLLLAQFCSYKLAKFYFKKTSIAWIFSVAYSFSAFFPSVSNAGHPAFYIAAALIPAVLLQFEKMLIFLDKKSLIFASLSLMLLFFTDLQITMFTIYYLILRIGYYFITKFDKKWLTLKRLLQLSALFSLVVMPFLISFSAIQNVQALSVPQISSQYLVEASEFFCINMGHISGITGVIITSFYIGIIVFALSIIPIIFYNSQEKSDHRNYLFHLFGFVFFFLISLGTPLSTLVTQLFVRVPSRSQIFVIFCACMCAGYGIILLAQIISRKMAQGNSHRFGSILRNRSLQTLLVVGLAVVIFVDLGSAVSPVTYEVPKFTGGDEFIASQAGDFRILKYPIIWAYTNYESSLLNHEILGVSIIALRSYPTASELFLKTINTFGALDGESPEDIGNFTLLSTLCGVKYVLIETNDTDTYNSSAQFINYFNNASGYFSEVYKGEDSIVYENLHFRGTVFVIKDEGKMPVLQNLTLKSFSEMLIEKERINFTQGFNSIEISGTVSCPAYVVMSQSYSPFWIKSSDGSAVFMKLLNVTAFHTESGSFKINAVFSAAIQTSNLFIVSYVGLILSSLALYASSKDKNNWIKLILLALTVFGLVTVILALMGTNIAPQSLRNLGIFSGVFNTIILLLGGGIAIFSVICLLQGRLFSRILFTFKNISSKASNSALLTARCRALTSCALIGSFALITLAFLLASQVPVMKLQPTIIDGNYTESYIAVGSQLSLNNFSIVLLLIALSLIVIIGVDIARKFLADLRKGIITPKLIELFSLFSLIVIITFEIYNKGLVSAVALVGNQLFWVMTATVLLVITITLFQYRPVVLILVYAIQEQIANIGRNTITIMRTLLIVSLALIVLTNVIPMFSDGTDWLNANMSWILIMILSLYALAIVSLNMSQKLSSTIMTKTTLLGGGLKQDIGIKNVFLGIFGGVVGVCVAGLLMWIITTVVQSYVGSALILCGVLGGLGFGTLTSGNKKLRGIIGCCFGASAILFGLVMTFNAPIIIGYQTMISSDSLVPIYMWQSFGSFIENQFLNLNGLFYAFFGLFLAYLISSNISLHSKLRKRMKTFNKLVN